MVALVGLPPVTWITFSPSNLSTWFKQIATPPWELLKSSPKSYDLDNPGRHFGYAAKSDFWGLGSASDLSLVMQHGCVGWLAPSRAALWPNPWLPGRAAWWSTPCRSSSKLVLVGLLEVHGGPPSPNCPSPSAPQHFRSPLSRMAQVCPNPADTATAVLPVPRLAVGVGVSLLLSSVKSPPVPSPS